MCIRDRLPGWGCRGAWRGSARRRLDHVADRVERGAVSYTHLDVYKRQADDLCVAALDVLPASSPVAVDLLTRRVRTLTLLGRTAEVEACLLYTSRCV